MSIVNKMKMLQLRWFGYMMTMDEKSLVKEISEMEIIGKKKKRRPK